MSILFTGVSGNTYGGLGTSQWRASVPAETALGDLLVHYAVLGAGASIFYVDMDGWTVLAIVRGSSVIAVKYAEDFDVGGSPGVVCTGRVIDHSEGDFFPSSITCCYSGVHDYGGVVSLFEDTASTVHTVPAVLAPNPDTTIVALGQTLPPGGGFDVPYTGSIPAFTMRGHYQGFAFGEWWTNGCEIHDGRAGGTGLVGPWTGTETGTDKKVWNVLGLLPNPGKTHVYLTPFSIPLGNEPIHTLAVEGGGADDGVIIPGGGGDTGGGGLVTGQIYWGARIDGAFYNENSGTYGSVPADDAPWSGPTVGASWDLFEEHAGKAVTAIHWGGPGSTLPPSFDQVANARTRARGAFSAYSVAASTQQMNDLASNSNTNGTLTLVDNWCAQVQSQGYPMLARFAWEMNGNWSYPWQTGAGISSTTYKSAFNNWAARVLSQTDCVSICWCPNVEHGVTDPTPWFPGETYLDWLFMDGYNNLTATYASPSTVFGTTVPIFQGLSDLPIGIWETGCAAPTGSPGKAAWITDFLSTWLPANPVKAFFWFNERGNPALPHIEVGNSSSTFGGAAQTAFAAGIADDYFAANIVDGVSFPVHTKVPIPS